MEVFNEDIKRLRRYIKDKMMNDRKVRSIDSADIEYTDFLNKGTSTIVLKEDTWVELGNPKTFSLAPVLVTENFDSVNDGTITLIGPDFREVQGSIPFAQIILISSTELKDEDYRKINTFQYKLELKDYMIKAVPSSLSIWSRISKDSVHNGFSFEVLGKAIIDSYKSRFTIQSVEVIFITSSEEDIKELKDIYTKVKRIISAMNKMIEEMSFDCSTCEYLDICNDVRELSRLKERLIKT